MCLWIFHQGSKTSVEQVPYYSVMFEDSIHQSLEQEYSLIGFADGVFGDDLHLAFSGIKVAADFDQNIVLRYSESVGGF